MQAANVVREVQPIPFLRDLIHADGSIFPELMKRSRQQVLIENMRQRS
jgi:hypothetical protein